MGTSMIIPMTGRPDIRTHIVEVCHRLYSRGMVTATDGNVSVRLPAGTVLITRSGISKGDVTSADLVELTLEGTQVGGSGKPSTESAMHVFIYRERPDIHAVVHAHPTYATGFAAARKALNACVFPEVIVGLGAIPLAGYATPSTSEVPNSLRPFVKSADAILLANHGVVTYAASLTEAYQRMEKVEHAAHITFVAMMLGGPVPLTQHELEDLQRVSVQSYGKDASAKPACLTADDDDDHVLTEADLRAYILQALRKRGIG